MTLPASTMLNDKAVPTCPERGIWSSQSAQRWEDALVSGNGRMGVMVFGDPEHETIIANHCRLFLPLGSREILPDLAVETPKLRSIITEKGYEEAMTFLLGKAKEQGFPGIINTDPFHPGLFIHIDQPSHGNIANYSRTENFATGEITVQWTDDNGTWRRRSFVSRADNVIAVCLDGTSPLNCTMSFPPLNPMTCGRGGQEWSAQISPDLIKSCQQVSSEWFTVHNIYSRGKGGYDVACRILREKGTAIANGARINFTDTEKILLLIRIAPWKIPLPGNLSEAWAYSPDNPDFSPPRLGRFTACPPLADSSVTAYAKEADALALMPQLCSSLKVLDCCYHSLLKRHTEIHRPIFERCSLDLGASEENRKQNSEALLDSAVRTGEISTALTEKIYDAGRYMFLCCSGELPPNLQGLWTGTWQPAWSGDFTLDTNLQLAIKHGFSGNCQELMEGYFRLMESFYPEWRLNAERCYGCKGFLTNTRASNTALLIHWGPWWGIFWTAGCSWLARPFYEHYLYTGDIEFLRTRTVPLLEQVTAFYEDFAVVNQTTGKIEFLPSYSPETGPGITATMDVMAMRDAVQNLIDASQVLNIHENDIPRWKSFLSKLPDYRINNDKALAEWIPNQYPEEYGHRHMSHLHSACEANGELGSSADPKLLVAARETVCRKINSCGEPSSHGRVHMGLAAAELGMAEEAWGRINIMATQRSMLPSLMCSHEPNARIFNVDANGAMPEIIHRMLFRSGQGRIDLLPALPKAWLRGEIRGILTKEQIKIECLSWDAQEKTASCVITGPVGRRITFGMPWFDPSNSKSQTVEIPESGRTSITLNNRPSYT